MPSLKLTVATVLQQLATKPVTVQVGSQSVLIGKEEVQVVTALQAGDLES
jgi:hypothetical protein